MEMLNMNLFASALAEGTAQLNLTPDEAAAVGAILGFGIGATVMVLVLLFVLQAIADWKIFTKAGVAGWESLIPFYNVIVEYGISWNTTMGIVSVACGVCTAFLHLRSGTPNWQVLLFFIVSIVAFVLHIIQSLKLAKCFGKGTGFGLFLILCGPIARLVLGLGKARYIGKQ